MTNEYKEGVYAVVGLHPIHTGASYHDEKELGEGGKEFTSRGEVFDKNSYIIRQNFVSCYNQFRPLRWV